MRVERCLRTCVFLQRRRSYKGGGRREYEGKVVRLSRELVMRMTFPEIYIGWLKCTSNDPEVEERLVAHSAEARSPDPDFFGDLVS